MDETYLFVHVTYLQPDLLQVQKCIRHDAVDKPTLVLMATAPPKLENVTAIICGIDVSVMKYFSDRTSRKIISYNLNVVSPNEGMNEDNNVLRRFATDENTKKALIKSDYFAIVYCRSRRVGDDPLGACRCL